MNLTVAIPTYGRNRILINTINALLGLKTPPWELLIIDQTLFHDVETAAILDEYDKKKLIRWIRLEKPSITKAMNKALLEAKGESILFLDDDLIPDSNLLDAHAQAGIENPLALIAGRVLQPWHHGNADPPDAPFLFNTLTPRLVYEFMGGNFSLSRDQAIQVGGFDENFVRVAYRFEAEFAYRWKHLGYPIIYHPKAIIHHIKAARGGTRSYGLHLKTLGPDHSVGRYYYRFRTQSFGKALILCSQDLLKSIKTRHHFKYPWWIPFTLIAELRGFLWGLYLYLHGPTYIPSSKPRVLIIGSHPVQYQIPLFKALYDEPSIESEVLYIDIPTASTQGLGFGLPFTWDVPMLEGYKWKVADSARGGGITSGYFGLWLYHPTREIRFGPLGLKPDVIFMTGWHFFGLVQLYLASLMHGIPIILRIETNDLGEKSLPLALLHWILLRGVNIGLTIGKANKRYLMKNGLQCDQLVSSPYHIDNLEFGLKATQVREFREQLRTQWQIPLDSFCFLFAGKLQSKKRPEDILHALIKMHSNGVLKNIHLLIVGTGELETKCKNIVQTYQLPVSFAGFLNQSEIVRSYAASDCLILPSDLGETWGLVVNEAMACRLPAIASNSVGCGEDLILHQQTGILYRCGNIDELSQAMLFMANHPNESQHMGNNGYNLVTQKYSVEKAKSGVLSAIHLAVGRHKKRNA